MDHHQKPGQWVHANRYPTLLIVAVISHRQSAGIFKNRHCIGEMNAVLHQIGSGLRPVPLDTLHPVY